MSEVVKRLRDRRHNVWDQAKKLADVAADENRAFNGEEQSHWDTLNGELNALDTRITARFGNQKRSDDKRYAKQHWQQHVTSIEFQHVVCPTLEVDRACETILTAFQSLLRLAGCVTHSILQLSGSQ